MITPETRILIVDDSASFRALMKKTLTSLGYSNFIMAEDGFKAMHALQTNASQAGSKPIGLILSDWNMPECNGMKFFKLIKSTENLDKIPFIMVTSENEITQIMEAISFGVKDYIVKPPDAEVLRKKIEAINVAEEKGK